MTREEFNKKYAIKYKDYFSAFDSVTNEQIMLLRADIYLKSKPFIPFTMVSEKVILDLALTDYRTINGEDAFNAYLQDRINNKIDLTFQIED
jgi:hypothetical protein